MYIIAIEGIDASGKETQVKKLYEVLSGAGYKVAVESFPRYDRPIGKLIKQALTGGVNISPEALHVLYDADRYDFNEEINRYEKAGYDFLILDRWILSNQAYCMAKGLDVDWIRKVQSNLRKPDITLVMDITAETSLKRKPARDDKHELDTGLLNRARTAYAVLTEQLSDIHGEDELIYLVDANRPVDEIHKEVIRFIVLCCLTVTEDEIYDLF